MYLFEPISLDECHAWFHLHGIHRAVSNVIKRKIQNENICLQQGSNQRPLALQLDALAIRLRCQFTTFVKTFTLLLDTCDNASMKLIALWFVHTKFCKQ